MTKQVRIRLERNKAYGLRRQGIAYPFRYAAEYRTQDDAVAYPTLEAARKASLPELVAFLKAHRHPQAEAAAS